MSVPEANSVLKEDEERTREHTRDVFHQIQAAFEWHLLQLNFSTLMYKSMFLYTFAGREDRRTKQEQKEGET